MYQMGYVMNGLLLGYMSDRFGRRPTLWLAMTIEVCGGLSLIFSPTITMYIMSRFFVGLGDSGRGVSLYLLILETVGTKYRSDIVMTVTFGWITGYIALPGAAWILKDYQLLQAIPTTVTFVLMCTWLLTIPESPRWQLSNNQHEKARVTIIKAAKLNGHVTNVDYINDQLDQLRHNSEVNLNKHKKRKHYTIVDLLSSKVMRNYTLIFWFSFAVNAFIYHGISLNVQQIGGNLYVNFAIAGLVEIPSLILNIVGLKYVGRKTFTVATMAMASLSYLAIVLCSAYRESMGVHYNTAKLIMAMFGKLFIFSSFNVIYIHAGEIFPTVLRHTGIGSCSIAARIGSILAPFVREMSEHYNFVISMMVFGLLALMATLLTLFLPETKDRDIPDNIMDVEELHDLSGSNSADSDNITYAISTNIIKETDNI
ncbi:unnamed protein product [Medioppia subpectinata]|uniref:Major facilitator superfamily (MFS) profile domain-containing protein n=1 Tax=Medioppia subpectinata TaxID=1979941 RepID=A0A7R9KID0_9ACAR|nr:unnamed protein product [Medioppia subpectinata]CAG2102725.1 unnamed protein product [Medioppia subpectinata]